MSAGPARGPGTARRRRPRCRGRGSRPRARSRPRSPARPGGENPDPPGPCRRRDRSSSVEQTITSRVSPPPGGPARPADQRNPSKAAQVCRGSAGCRRERGRGTASARSREPVEELAAATLARAAFAKMGGEEGAAGLSRDAAGRVQRPEQLPPSERRPRPPQRSPAGPTARACRRSGWACRRRPPRSGPWSGPPCERPRTQEPVQVDRLDDVTGGGANRGRRRGRDDRLVRPTVVFAGWCLTTRWTPGHGRSSSRSSAYGKWNRR